jgi:hypothetical protein
MNTSLMVGSLNPAFAKRDQKQTRTDLRGISINWLRLPMRLSSLRAQGYALTIFLTLYIKNMKNNIEFVLVGNSDEKLDFLLTI